jgi:hypothetical protein
MRKQLWRVYGFKGTVISDAVAPAEWDLKRLVTSAIVGGRHAGYSEKTIRTCSSSPARTALR